MKIIKKLTNKKVLNFLIRFFDIKYSLLIFIISFSLHIILTFTLENFKNKPEIVIILFDTFVIYSCIGIIIFLIKVFYLIIKRLHKRFSYMVIFLFFSAIIAVLFLSYMYKYQQIVNEGSAIEEERCLIIDPLIVKHKDVGEKWVNAYESSGSAETINSYANEYIITTEELIKASDPWLQKEYEFLNRKDFQIFTHPVLKEVFYAQYKKYLADYDANGAYLGYLNNPTDKNIIKKLAESVVKMYKLDKELTDSINKAEQSFDLRHYFIKVPELRCDEVDYNPGIPVTINGPTG